MRLSLSRATSLSSYLGLIGWLMAWILWFGEVPRNQISLLLVLAVTPLLIPLRGILAGYDKSLLWGALLALPYALHGSMVAVVEQPPQRWLGMTEAALSLVYLVSASLYIRWRADAAN